MRQAEFIELHDFEILCELIICFAIAGLVPEKKWRAVCRQLVRTKSLFGAPKATPLLGPALGELELDSSPDHLIREHRIACLLEETEVSKEYLPGGWKSQLNLDGKSFVDESLSRGNGAILWTYACRHGDLAIKKALFRAGVKYSHLRSNTHPYSKTLFGVNILNHIRNKIENRYVDNVITLVPGEETKSLREISNRLRRNEVVSITAVGAENTELPLSFLSGQLKLARGAIVLSKRTGAPIHPVFIAPKKGGLGLDVEIQEMLLDPRNGTAAKYDDAEYLEEYANRLIEQLKISPAIWRGWVTQSLWKPRFSG